jgi:hypothetical protein
VNGSFLRRTAKAGCYFLSVAADGERHKLLLPQIF